jgi:hypothetical protein
MSSTSRRKPEIRLILVYLLCSLNPDNIRNITNLLYDRHCATRSYGEDFLENSQSSLNISILQIP